MDMIYSLVVDEIVADGRDNGMRKKTKSIIDDIHGYDTIGDEGSSKDDSAYTAKPAYQNMQPPVYLEGDEDGFPGLQPPDTL